MGLRSSALKRFFKLQSGLAETYAKMPRTVQKFLISGLNNDQRITNADELMKLILGVHRFMNVPIMTNNIQNSRAIFRSRIKEMRGKSIESVLISDFEMDVQIRKIKARLYRNKNDTSATACILFIHGGGFCMGDLDTQDEFCQYLCFHTGMSVVSIDYRLAPEFPAPAAIEDCLSAIEWLHANAEILRIDQNAIYISGESSGANLATVVANKTKNTDIAPKAQLLINPITDFSKTYRSHRVFGNGLIFSSEDKQQMEYFYIHSSNHKVNDPIISPALGDLKQTSPAYIVTAELDLFVDEGGTYAHMLRSAKVLTHTQRMQGLPHGFNYLINMHKQSEQACIDIAKGFNQFTENLK